MSIFELGRDGLGWLSEPTVEALRAALRTVAPELAEGTIVPRGLTPSDDPRWCGASAVVDGRFVVKFAWAEPPARRIRFQAQIIDALRGAAPELPLPEVVAVSRDPALLITRRVEAMPFFDVRQLIQPADRPGVAGELARILATLHDPAVLREVAGLSAEPPTAAGLLGEADDPPMTVGLSVPPAEPPTATDTLRARLPAFVRPDQRARVLAWCDRADRALAEPGRRTVLVHGDFHGDNHLWDPATLQLRLLIDLETVSVGEPEFDLRCLPGDCGMELFKATVTRYEALTGTTLDTDRIMAWHLRTVLGDALWRAEAGTALPDNRTPADWVDDLVVRWP